MSRQRRRGPALPLDTVRLRIREFLAGDLDAVVGLYSDARVTRHMLYGPRDADAAQRHLARILRSQREPARESWELAVEPAGGGALVGACDLAVVGPREVEIGYLVAPSSWGQGLGTEVAAALVRVAFEELGAHRVQSTVEVRNHRSIRVLDKAGLRWEATLRRELRARQRRWDVHLYAVSREDWALARA